MEQTQALLKLQEADLTVLRAKNKLDSLPQKQDLLANAQKRAAIEEKATQIQEFITQREQRVDELQAEDAELAEQIAKSRKAIDETRDYRLIATVTRDMEGSMKRRDNIDFQLGKLGEDLDKAEKLKQQAAGMLEKCDKREAELNAQFNEAAQSGQQEIDQATKLREAAAAELPADLVARYEDLRRRKGGIGAGKLEDGHCSACRITFQEGQLARLLDGPDISTCPNCHRLIVVRNAASE